MAIELSVNVIEKLHQELTTTTPLGRLGFAEIRVYNTPGDYSDNMDFQHSLIWDIEANAVLLILAAEEELSGYPMEAISETI